MRLTLPLSCLLLLGSVADAQVLATSSLNGKYFMRHVEFTTDSNNNVTDIRSINGAITFDGAGNYSFTGQQTIGTTAAASFSATGIYTVASAGFTTLTNPQSKSFNINARYGVEALIGSSTEASGNTFDFFVAIPAPTIAPNNSSVMAGWNATDFELTGASTAQVRDSQVAMSLDGAGNIGTLTLSGHAANYNKGGTVYQTVAGGTYNINTDGTGTITFPLPAGISGAGPMLGQAARTLYVSKTGNILLAATPGGHDVFLAVRNATAFAAPGNGLRFWSAGIRVDSTGSSNSYAGSFSVAASDGSLLNTQRLHETGSTPLNVTEAATYTLATDGTGSAGPTSIALEQGFLTVGSNNGNPLDPTGYEILFAVPMPPVTGTGVFINPQGIFNAASNAPAGDALSPGEFIAIFGSGLVGSTTVASALPFPTSLGGVTVSINGFPAPIYFVSPGQIDCIVPYEVSGTTANITVNSNGTVSNTVSMALAGTSPGVFSLDGTGTHDGSITHANGAIVNAASPAIKGETVVMYVSGLGALTNTVKDGYGATAFNNATAQMNLYVAGVLVPATSVLYHGLTSSAGLYQINFTVPATLTVSGELPIAILTPDAFTDLVYMAVQ
jgi:uncharacterized protein (TIGR03437 family)